MNIADSFPKQVATMAVAQDWWSVLQDGRLSSNVEYRCI